MSIRSKIAATVVLLLMIGGLASVDGYMNRKELTAYVSEDTAQQASAPSVAQPTNSTNTFPDQTSSAVAVPKMTGPDVGAVAAEMGLAVGQGNEPSLIEQVVAGKASAQSLVILQNNDRAGAVLWVDSPDVKTYFLALKESLLSAFSPAVRDLRDATRNETGKPIRNILTFLDPALSEERLAFVRVRERLYEFHIDAKQEEVMARFMDAVTSK